MTIEERIREVKKRDVVILEGTKLKDDWYWLIEQAEKVERYENLFEEIKTHCVHCDADERTIQPYEILDIVLANAKKINKS